MAMKVLRMLRYVDPPTCKAVFHIAGWVSSHYVPEGGRVGERERE